MSDRINAINACLRRLEDRERKALDAATFQCGGERLPRPWLRSQLRAWFWERKAYFWNALAAEQLTAAVSRPTEESKHG